MRPGDSILGSSWSSGTSAVGDVVVIERKFFAICILEHLNHDKQCLPRNDKRKVPFHSLLGQVRYWLK